MNLGSHKKCFQLDPTVPKAGSVTILVSKRNVSFAHVNRNVHQEKRVMTMRNKKTLMLLLSPFPPHTPSCFGKQFDGQGEGSKVRQNKMRQVQVESAPFIFSLGTTSFPLLHLFKIYGVFPACSAKPVYFKQDEAGVRKEAMLELKVRGLTPPHVRAQS